jgi:hypothetical protein
MTVTLFSENCVKENINPQVTIAELRIYQIKVKQYKKPAIFFRDTWLLMQGKLSDLPKTFDLKCPAKLYFPHGYNKEENYGNN